MAEATTPTPEPTEAPADGSLLSAAAGDAAAVEAPASEGDPAAPKDEAVEEGAPADLPQAGAPEAYELTPPEGMEIDPDLLKAVTDDLKAANIGPDQAQKLAENVYPKIMERAVAAVSASNEAAFAETAATWEKEARADPEFKDWSASMAKVAAGRDAFASPKLIEFLDLTKLGNNPEVLRFFKTVGERVSTATVHNGGVDAPAPAKAQLRDLYNKEG